MGQGRRGTAGGLLLFMPDPFAKHAAGIKAHQAYLGAACPSVGFNGANVPVLPGTAKLRKNLEAGGFRLTSDFEFVATLDAWPDGPPTLLQDVVYLGQSYRVDAVETLPGGILQRFSCNNPNQAA